MPLSINAQPIISPIKLQVPVITLDGPSASGKGTLATRLASRISFNYLDSGALYRILAFQAQENAVTSDDIAALTALILQLNIRFVEKQTFIGNRNISQEIRTEAISRFASEIAVHHDVRLNLLAWQRQCQQPPGLVTDGRDMGTVVFPTAKLKIFVTASLVVRAERRFQQLCEAGISASLAAVYKDLQQRDDRDSQRAVAPLLTAVDAKLLDTSSISADEALAKLLSWCDEIGLNHVNLMN